MLLLHHGDEKKQGHTDSYCSVLHNTYHLLKYNYTGHLGESLEICGGHSYLNNQMGLFFGRGGGGGPGMKLLRIITPMQ